jgi:putative flippase GtrA
MRLPAIISLGNFRELRFVRFCAVGTVGFAVDALVLTVLIKGYEGGAVQSRFASFSVAVFVTYILNRNWAFHDRPSRGVLISFLQYLGVQAAGFLCNLSVYAALIFMMPAPFNAPILCLVAASAVAMFVNFAGARRIVFVTRE